MTYRGVEMWFWVGFVVGFIASGVIRALREFVKEFDNMPRFWNR